ncbi:MAG: VrlD [Pontiella sp.]
MIVQRQGGMTEFIPSPQEKREGLVRDHSFNLIENLHQRLKRLEEEVGLPLEDAEACSSFLEKLKRDESENIDINTRVFLKNTKKT